LLNFTGNIAAKNNLTQFTHVKVIASQVKLAASEISYSVKKLTLT